MREVTLRFHSIMNGEFPPKDGYYIILSEDALDPENTVFNSMWWDSRKKLWYTHKATKTEGFVPIEYWGNWWAEKWEIGLENK